MDMEDQRQKNGTFKTGHNFAKGRPKLTDEEVELRKMTTQKSHELINKWIFSTEAELKAGKENPNSTVFDLAIINIIEKSFTGRSLAPIKFLTDRLLGKIK